MPTTQTQRKQPQDRRPKSTTDTAGEQGSAHLTVTIDGITYTSTRPVAKLVTFGIMRRYADNEGLMAIRLIEKAFEDQPDVLDALDEFDQEQIGELGAEMFGLLEEDQGASAGESSRSSS